MYAIEFETRIENGVVNIPKEYSDVYQGQARVLVLIDKPAKQVERKKYYVDFFNALRNRHIKIPPNIDIDELMSV